MSCFKFFHHHKDATEKNHIILKCNINNLYRHTFGPGHRDLRLDFINRLSKDPTQFVFAKPSEDPSEIPHSAVSAFTNCVYGEFDISKVEYEKLISHLNPGKKIDGVFFPDTKLRDKMLNKLFHHMVRAYIDIQNPETQAWKNYKTINFHLRWLDNIRTYSEGMRTRMMSSAYTM